jgi:hypothetical protein
MEELPGKANYFMGSDPANWHSNVPTYGKVGFRDVYPGLDLVYYGKQGQLEYDFIVAPGADPTQARLHFAGAAAVRVNSRKDLVVSTKQGEIAFHKPVAYQWKDGERKPVKGRFTLLAKNTVGFSVGDYDHARQLTIDPALSYSTYLGGNGGQSGDIANAIAVDADGNAYVTGSAGSANFPVTADAFQRVDKGKARPAPNGFLSKLNPTGTALVYSTYFGGSGGIEIGQGDAGNGVAVDALGNAYVAGVTYSADFPVTSGSFQTKKKSTGSNGFVTKFDATGAALLYSTYLGGSSAGRDYWTYDDRATAIALDAAGSVYVTGYTYSTDFPITPGAFQTVNKAAPRNGTAFVTKLNPTGAELVYSTYLGGSGRSVGSIATNYGDAGQGIAIDILGNAYVAGFTFSSDFPVTAGAFQTTSKAVADSKTSAFVTKLKPLGTALAYSTYLSGSGDGDVGGVLSEAANAIALDAEANAYVTGYAYSTDFPVTKGAFQTTNLAAKGCHSGCANAFINKLNTSGEALIYSTYLGGTSSGLAPYMWAVGAGIAVDAGGEAYICGTTLSPDFPVTPGAFQTKIGPVGGPFLAKLDASGTNLVYSSFLMGGGNRERDDAYAIALDVNGNAFLAGQTYSNSFPVTVGAFQTTNNAYPPPYETTNAFVAKFGIGSGPLLP